MNICKGAGIADILMGVTCGHTFHRFRVGGQRLEGLKGWSPFWTLWSCLGRKRIAEIFYVIEKSTILTNKILLFAVSKTKVIA